MRVIFCGTPALALPTLEAVSRAHDVLAVVCQPDRPQGRSKKPVAPPTKAWALEQGIPVHQPEKLNDGAFETWLRELAPDLGVLVAYGRILKTPILEAPRHGWLNMHPSLLPRWRGPSPIQSALYAGDQETGVSIMQLALDMDAGDVAMQRTVSVPIDEDHVALSDRLSRLGAEMMLETMASLAEGTATFTPQDHAHATYCGLITKEHGRIDWTRDSLSIHNQIRASVPWPVAHCRLRGEVYRIIKSRLSDSESSEAPGAIVSLSREAITVATGKGCMEILELQPPGKRAMQIRDFLAGNKIDVGERFEEMN